MSEFDTFYVICTIIALVIMVVLELVVAPKINDSGRVVMPVATLPVRVQPTIPVMTSVPMYNNTM
jgi:hypothetical protein